MGYNSGLKGLIKIHAAQYYVEIVRYSCSLRGSAVFLLCLIHGKIFGEMYDMRHVFNSLYNFFLRIFF
jgi:hypothetical protein